MERLKRRFLDEALQQWGSCRKSVQNRRRPNTTLQQILRERGKAEGGPKRMLEAFMVARARGKEVFFCGPSRRRCAKRWGGRDGRCGHHTKHHSRERGGKKHVFTPGRTTLRYYSRLQVGAVAGCKIAFTIGCGTTVKYLIAERARSSPVAPAPRTTSPAEPRYDKQSYR